MIKIFGPTSLRGIIAVVAFSSAITIFDDEWWREVAIRRAHNAGVPLVVSWITDVAVDRITPIWRRNSQCPRPRPACLLLLTRDLSKKEKRRNCPFFSFLFDFRVVVQ